MMHDYAVESVCHVDNENSEKGMTERRQHRRFNVENMGVDCDMPSTSRVKLMNIGSGGALVMADKLINVGKSYALKIAYKDKQLFVKADAVWALLADCVREVNGDVVPIYIAGMQFVDVLRGEVREIMQLLEANSEKTPPGAFEGILQGNSYNEIIVN